MTGLSRSRMLAVAGAALFGLGASQARAQVYYAPPHEAFYPFGVPYDESYDRRYAFAIVPNAYGAPAVGVVQRCAYPDGWNVTDFVRDVNGTPAGIDHTCPYPPTAARVRSRY